MSKNKKVLKLDEVFSIRQENNNCILDQSSTGLKTVKNKDTGEDEQKEYTSVKSYFYGTLYQCLQGYLTYSVNQANSLKDARKISIRILDILTEAEMQIKDMFRTEVRVVR